MEIGKEAHPDLGSWLTVRKNMNHRIIKNELYLENMEIK